MTAQPQKQTTNKEPEVIELRQPWIDSQKVSFPSVVYKLMQSFEFSHLHRIFQQGHAPVMFSGRGHSRSDHSLGAAKWAALACDVLEEHCNTVIEAQQKDPHKYNQLKEALLVSMLLHDLGHMPLSHLSEAITHALGIPVDHEEVTRNLIAGLYTDDPTQVDPLVKANYISTKLNGYRLGLSDDVLRIMDKEFLAEESQLTLFSEYDSPEFRKLGALFTLLFSSQFDCDRIDYVLRDSANLNERYEKADEHISPDDILKIFEGLDVEERPGDNSKKLTYGLVVSENAVPLMHKFFNTYRLDYNTICYNPHVRGCDRMLEEILAQTINNPNIRKVLTPFPDNPFINILTQENFRLDDFLFADDKSVSDFVEWVRDFETNNPSEELEKLQQDCTNYLNNYIYARVGMKNTDDLLKSLAQDELANQHKTRSLPKGHTGIISLDLTDISEGKSEIHSENVLKIAKAALGNYGIRLILDKAIVKGYKPHRLKGDKRAEVIRTYHRELGPKLADTALEIAVDHYIFQSKPSRPGSEADQVLAEKHFGKESLTSMYAGGKWLLYTPTASNTSAVKKVIQYTAAQYIAHLADPKAHTQPTVEFVTEQIEPILDAGSKSKSKLPKILQALICQEAAAATHTKR